MRSEDLSPSPSLLKSEIFLLMSSLSYSSYNLSKLTWIIIIILLLFIIIIIIIFTVSRIKTHLREPRLLLRTTEGLRAWHLLLSQLVSDDHVYDHDEPLQCINDYDDGHLLLCQLVSDINDIILVSSKYESYSISTLGRPLRTHGLN